MAFQKEGMGQGLSGRLGGVVYRRVDGETIACRAPERVNPNTPAQAAARARLERAVALWAALPMDGIERWRRYAETGPGNSRPALPGGGGRRRAGGYAVFRGLAAKYLQIHGGFEAPIEPPTTSFLGDGIAVLAEADPTPSPHQGEGIRFSSDFPNTPGVVTELLVQRLPARHRLPKARDYRTAAFVAFAGEPARAPLPAGAYACAVRFVRAATGQATAMVPIGTVEVP